MGFSRGSWMEVSVCIILGICLSDLMVPPGKICEIIIAGEEGDLKVGGNAGFIKRGSKLYVFCL